MDNPLLALQVQPPSIDIAGSLTRGQEMRTASLGNILEKFKLDQAQRQAQRENALASLYQENGAGLVNGDTGAINNLAAVDPQAALGFRDSAVKAQGEKVDLQQKRTGQVAGFLGAVVQAPDAAKPMVYQWARQQLADEGHDVSKMPAAYSPEILPQLQATTQAAVGAQNQITNARNEKIDSPEYKGKVAKAEAEAREPSEERVARARAAADAENGAGWQVMQDPSNGKQFRYNARTSQATDLTGAPYTPGGAGKLVASQARSPAAMFLQKYQQEHPNAGSAELADVAATFGAQQKAVKDFATGPEGNIITRINTAVSHLDTLQKVGEALDNGDVQAFNKLRNIWRTQFGSELPTNFNAAMPIVAGEVSKAVVGTQGGTREDRAELEASLQDAASKKQLAGATGTQKSLLQGQLQSRRRQYETSTGRKDFDKFLSGDTQRELGVDTPSQIVPGTVQEGYKFKGGDPADKNNWVKQ